MDVNSPSMIGERNISCSIVNVLIRLRNLLQSCIDFKYVNINEGSRKENIQNTMQLSSYSYICRLEGFFFLLSIISPIDLLFLKTSDKLVFNSVLSTLQFFVFSLSFESASISLIVRNFPSLGLEDTSNEECTLITGA